MTVRKPQPKFGWHGKQERDFAIGDFVVYVGPIPIPFTFGPVAFGVIIGPSRLLPCACCPDVVDHWIVDWRSPLDGFKHTSIHEFKLRSEWNPDDCGATP